MCTQEVDLCVRDVITEEKVTRIGDGWAAVGDPLCRMPRLYLERAATLESRATGKESRKLTRPS